MFKTIIATALALISGVAGAAPTWQTISAEPGKRIEIDRVNLKREDGNKVLALGRVILDRELMDNRTGNGYRIIEATTRYDCASRSASTVKRVFKKNENEIIREDEVNGAEMPVRSGTLDDKVLREVCRPPKESAADIAQKANEAGSKLKEANEALLKKEVKEVAKAEAVPEPAPVVKITETHGSIPSIRPNLKAAAEAAKASEQPAPAPAPVAKVPEVAKPPAIKAAMPAPVAAPTPEPRSHTVVVRTKAEVPSRSTREKSAKPKAEEGYMLEIAHKTTSPAMEHAHIHWSYEGEGGPQNWAAIDPANIACAKGQRQSPIDIREGIRVDLEPIKFDYNPSTFRIVNNGHTVQVEVGNSRFNLTGKTYDLVQFHFHRPAEERVNGRGFEMVAHLVHKAYDGELAVVAVLIEKGAENPFIQTLWNNLPLEKNRPVQPPDPVVDLKNLLPTDQRYYTYIGSLTTPPCTEGIRWIVLKQPVQASADQIGIFSRLYRNNARPIQPTGDRLIKESR